MRRIRWASQALRDIIRITDYFASREPDYPLRLLDKVHRIALLLAEQPSLGARLASTPYRKMRVQGTNYLLLFRATGTELTIARVRHAKEDWRPL